MIKIHWTVSIFNLIVIIITLVIVIKIIHPTYFTKLVHFAFDSNQKLVKMNQTIPRTKKWKSVVNQRDILLLMLNKINTTFTGQTLQELIELPAQKSLTCIHLNYYQEKYKKPY